MNRTFCIIVFLVMVCTASFVSAANLLWSRGISMNPTAPSVGQRVTFIATFNVNPGPAVNISVSGGVDGVTILNRSFARTFATGASQQVSFVWTATAGNHRAFFTIDPGNAIRESNEADNTTQINFSVSSTGTLIVIGAVIPPIEMNDPNKSDLIIDEVAWTPSPIMNGQMVEYRAHVVNRGNRGTLRDFKVDFTIICGSTTMVLGEPHVAPLGPGQSQNVIVKAVFTAQFPEWLTIPGNCNIFTEADMYHKIAETNETNNGNTKILTF